MLKLEKITKIYETEDLKQKALNSISLGFRKSEFVSILGQSGSGKTTLLNIIGGLDQYTRGNLIISGVSTKEYDDRDWDIYRNHKVGFIFQSYNLISHQTILANVELALTLSGVSKQERRRRAKKALKEVGLGEHINKKPNQLSGGQMQRVAIARALINDPEIILADEPTGALDSETSVQIMNLLKEIAKNKLVIMVTHNPELAHEYSTRIIELKDGKIISDSDPFDGEEEIEEVKKRKKANKKNSMSFKTAFELSLNNLMTKKGRTFLTAFAGSIGIIGIAVILSVSTGVHNFISKTEEETLTSYPISIEKTTIDVSGFTGEKDKEIVECEQNEICSNNMMGNLISATSSSQLTNNLSEFKKYLDSSEEVQDLANDIKYKYGFDLQVYLSKDDNIVKVNPSTLLASMTGVSLESAMLTNSSTMNQGVFKELVDNEKLLETQYDIVAGKLPSNYDEIVLIADENNQITDFTMYALGLKDQKELADLRTSIMEGKEYNNEVTSYTYEDILNLTYKVVLNTDYYKKEKGKWVDKSTDASYVKELVQNGIELKIVGIVKPNEESTAAESNVIGYTHNLVEYIMEQNNKADIAKEQLDNNKINVFTGEEFDNITNTYDGNLQKLGVASLEDPTSIEIYPKSFDAKERLEELISDYNDEVKESGEDEKIITYTDYVGIIMSGVTTIIDVITIGLIGFVGVSLIVSCIMIAIITYISVLERTKEIGILRAIGASKKDISRVFNAETFIEGLVSGVLGICLTLVINVIINVVIKNYANVSNIAHLELGSAIALIIVSVVLTVIAGFVPAKVASKRNPVESLRTE